MGLEIMLLRALATLMMEVLVVTALKNFRQQILAF
jgi:hypothetical protein